MSKSKTIVRNQEVFVGVDVHTKDYKINLRTNETEVFKSTIPGDYLSLKNILKRCPDCQIKIAYEAGPHGFTLYDKLTLDGYDCIVTPPTMVLEEKRKRVKTDKRDARKLAMLLEKGLLKKIYVLTPEERSHRQLVRTRRQIVNHRKASAQQIKSLLLFNDVKCPFPEHQHWSKKYMLWLESLRFEYSELKQSLEILLNTYNFLSLQIKHIEKHIKILSQTPKYKDKVAVLSSIPGIGWLSAIEILVELQEIGRFKTPEELASFIGLTPSENSSGESQRKGGITHMGSGRLRSLLVEDSWTLIRYDNKWRNKYNKIKYRKGSQKAIVAIARGLVHVIWKLLTSNEVYKYNYNHKAAA